MCGIIGVLNNKEAFRIVKKGLRIIRNRGKDGSGYFDGEKIEFDFNKTSTSKDIIAHNLHSIVDNIRQPIKHEGKILAANCEIYNWKKLKKEHNIKASNDAELLLKLILKLGIKKTLKEIRGVYAFAFRDEYKIYLARDIIGVKPLWYSTEKGLAFCSEKKGIKEDYSNIKELNPRKLLIYDIKKNKISFSQRPFFRLTPVIKNKEYALKKTSKLLKEAVNIRIPGKKTGLLFSGGIDSVIIAKLLKDAGKDFFCYTAATSEENYDLKQAKKAAKILDVKLKYKIVDKDTTAEYIKKVVPLIEDNNVIKTGVALPMYIASSLAKKDGCKVVLSGSGADEIFAGYNRYKQTPNPEYLNKDCYSGLLNIYEKNTYRDDVVTMNQNLELRVPYLDKSLASFALRITPSLKIKDSEEKWILRKAAENINIPKTLSKSPKKAAQYGSGFDKHIKKLAGKKKKSEFLKEFLPEKNLKLAALISSGKDSLFALHKMKQQNYEIACAITIKSTNPSSYMFHTPNISIAELQAKAMSLPVITHETEGIKEKELDDLYKAIKKAIEKYNIEGIITGAIFSNYQRERVENICDRLGMKVFSPLWHMNQEEEMREILKNGFKIMFSSIASYGLNKEWLARTITEEDINRLIQLNKKYGINIAGEGGEFESLVLDAPLFKKKVEITDYKINEENENTAFMIVKNARLVSKEY